MKFKVYYEDREGIMGGHEYVGFIRLCWWLFMGRIQPRERSTVYYIRKIEDSKERRI